MPDPVLGAYILAGGQSSRFGSDKARALVQGQPLLLRLVAQITTVTHLNITLVVNQPQRYADFEITTLTDLQPELGPMGGLHTALHHLVVNNQSGWILAVPCDLLEYQTVWHQHLLAKIPSAAPDIDVIAFWGDDWLPFPALYHTRLLPQITDCMQSQQRSLRKLLASLGHSAIPVNLLGLPEIRSANTREELDRYLEDHEDLR